MGQVKQLLPFRGSTVLGQIIGTVLQSKADEIIVVLGYQAQRITPKIARHPVKIVVNPDFEQGMSSSIKCGLGHISEKSDAIMIVLGDQPLIEKEIINLLVGKNYGSERGIVVPVYKGVKGHPVIFKMKYKDDLLGLTGDMGGKEIVEGHPGDVIEVEVDSESIIIGIDTKSDYQSLIGK